MAMETQEAWCSLTLGIHVKDEVSFLCMMQGNVVALVHDTEGAEDEENNILLNGLSHQSHLILRTQGLATGFCKDVHGQVGRCTG